MLSPLAVGSALAPCSLAPPSSPPLQPCVAVAPVVAVALEGRRRGRRRVAVLGEMLELGAGGEDIHREVGENIVSAGVGLLLTVGAGAEALGKSGRSGAAIHHCEDIAQARTRLGELLRPGDAVLLKGSNGSQVWRLADEMIGGEIVP